jgi:hypothetical protein
MKRISTVPRLAVGMINERAKIVVGLAEFAHALRKRPTPGPKLRRSTDIRSR